MGETDQKTDTREIWGQMRDRLLAYTRRRVATMQDAEDIVQDVFVRIHANLDQLQDTERLTPWIYRIARNALIDHHRRRATAEGTLAKLAETTDQDSGASGSEDPLASGSSEPAAGLAKCTAALMARLPEHQRQTMDLTELQGLTQQEAAEQLGLSVPGVKARVHSGRRQLKQLLVDCCDVELDRRRGVVDYEPRSGGTCGKCACD